MLNEHFHNEINTSETKWKGKEKRSDEMCVCNWDCVHTNCEYAWKHNVDLEIYWKIVLHWIASAATNYYFDCDYQYDYLNDYSTQQNRIQLHCTHTILPLTKIFWPEKSHSCVYKIFYICKQYLIHNDEFEYVLSYVIIFDCIIFVCFRRIYLLELWAQWTYILT